MRIVDLTLPLGPEVTPVPKHPRAIYDPITTLEKDGVNNQQLCFSLHTGTHVDPPIHFIKGGKTIDEIELDVLIGDAFLVDLRRFMKEGHGFTIEELVEGGLPDKESIRGKRVVLWSGWAQREWNKDLYGDNPYLSEEAVRYLVSSGVVLLAMDHGIDKGDPWFGHKHTLGNNIPLVENIVNLEQISRNSFTLVVMPLKLKSAVGGPARVAAIIE